MLHTILSAQPENLKKVIFRKHSTNLKLLYLDSNVPYVIRKQLLIKERQCSVFHKHIFFLTGVISIHRWKNLLKRKLLKWLFLMFLSLKQVINGNYPKAINFIFSLLSCHWVVLFHIVNKYVYLKVMRDLSRYFAQSICFSLELSFFFQPICEMDSLQC